MGVLTGVLAFIPSIGSVIAGVIAALVALAQGSSWIPVSNFVFALIVVGLYILLFQLESLYLLPRIVGRRVQLHPVVVIVGTIAGALVGGVLGIFLAAPVIASARVLLGYTYSKLLDQEPFQETEASPVLMPTGPRGQINGRTVEAVLFDLDGTLIETDDQAVVALAQRLKRVRLFLPQGDPDRAARRLVMWSHDGLNGWLALLDRIGLDRPAQRLAQRVGLLNDAASGKPLIPVSGTSDLLRQLSGRYKLAIVSTRRSDEVRVFLDQQGLNGEIQVVAGSDTTTHIKPHPQPLHWAMDRLSVTPEHTLMIGDTRCRSPGRQGRRHAGNRSPLRFRRARRLWRRRSDFGVYIEFGGLALREDGVRGSESQRVRGSEVVRVSGVKVSGCTPETLI